MPNLFTTIGFNVRQSVDFIRLMQEATAEGETLNARHGYYVRWSPGAGAELWVLVNTEREVIGCLPHFAGGATMPVRVHRLLPERGRPLQGKLDGWAGPDGDDATSGRFSLLVDLPDFDLVRRRLRPPVAVDLQIAAFANDLSCYRNTHEFCELKKQDPHLAVEAFLPTGMFAGASAEDGGATEAAITGTILAAELRTNPYGQQGFWAVQLQTCGGTVDVVADPLVVSGEPRAGGVAAGTFWLSGRIRGDQGGR